MTHPVHQAKTNRSLLVLDGSTSLLNWDPYTRRTFFEGSNAEKLVQVVDAEIARQATLARSGKRDPETGLLQEYRISIAQFASRGQYQMLIWEMDPRSLVDSGVSVGDLYKAGGNTAMCEAINRGLKDLATIPEKYGDHATLFMVFGDGAENHSDYREREEMVYRLGRLPDNVTVAMFVPDADCARTAKGWGIPEGNIQEWDATSEDGVFEVGRVVERAHTTWMENRAKGVRATRTLFSTGIDAVNDQTVKASLDLLDPKTYKIFVTDAECELRPFIQAQKWHDGKPITFKTRHSFYRLTKTETIQANKQILVMDTRTDEIYGGQHARDLIGLKDEPVRRGPDFNPNYAIFVMSGSVNRKLDKGAIVVWVP